MLTVIRAPNALLLPCCNTVVADAVLDISFFSCSFFWQQTERTQLQGKLDISFSGQIQARRRSRVEFVDMLINTYPGVGQKPTYRRTRTENHFVWKKRDLISLTAAWHCKNILKRGV
jgi:hypothetical protein